MKRLFRTLVDQHQQLIYSQALFILADRGDAEDATQEAYVRLWAALNKPNTDLDAESAKPWLLRVVRNLCIDKLRRRKPMAETELDEIQSQSSDGMPVSQLMTKQLTMAHTVYLESFKLRTTMWVVKVWPIMTAKQATQEVPTAANMLTSKPLWITVADTT